MPESNYIFTDAQFARELERLRAIEQVCAPASHRRITATEITAGWRCLEVGEGAGSITQWLANRVGESGKVIAIDLDTRFVAALKLPNTEVLQADILFY